MWSVAVVAWCHSFQVSHRIVVDMVQLFIWYFISPSTSYFCFWGHIVVDWCLTVIFYSLMVTFFVDRVFIFLASASEPHLNKENIYFFLHVFCTWVIQKISKNITFTFTNYFCLYFYLNCYLIFYLYFYLEFYFLPKF